MKRRVTIFLEDGELECGPAINIAMLPQIRDVASNDLKTMAALITHEIGRREGLEKAIEEILRMIQRGKLLKVKEEPNKKEV
jgi:hypothetical protein